MSKEDIKLNVGQEELSIKASLVMEDEIRYIDNNMETIVDTITKQIISDKDLAIAQHIIQKLQQENEANKKRIEELEEDKVMVLQRRNGKTIKLAMQLREEVLKLPTCKLYGIKNCKGKSILLTKDEVIPKAKVENLLKTKIIEYDCEDCITGKFIEVKDIEELLKDGGQV